MVAGGFELTSYTTLFTPSTSLAMRLEMRLRTSGGKENQSAVMPSRLVTARSGDDLIVAATVALDSYRPDGKQYREGLPDLLIEARGTRFPRCRCDRHGAESRGSRRRDLAHHPDGESGPRERMPAHHFIRQSQLPTHLTHLVLEQLAQWFNQLEGSFSEVRPRCDGS